MNIDPASFRAKYSIPSVVQILGPYAGNLQDSGERLQLLRPDSPDTNGVPYIVVDEVRYNDKLPWPPGADGDGPSIQRLAATAYGNEPTNWFASGITPGAQNVFNTAPTCVLTSPADGTAFQVPADIPLMASASDSDGAIAFVELYNGDVLLGTVTSAPYFFVWSNAPVGSHTLIAKARDNGLAITPSASVRIIVQPPPLGDGMGLRADYFDNSDFSGTRVRKIDSVVSFDWGTGQPDPAIGADTFSVRWVGQVQPRFSETYSFHVEADDGVRLWVNNQLLVDRWIDQGPTEYTGFIQLQAGLYYDIKMECYENGGGAVARLLWSSPSVTKEVIPSNQLFPPVSSNIPPNVTITGPATGAVFVATSTVTLSADTSDLDGAVIRVDYFSGATRIAQSFATPFTSTWPNVLAGEHVLRAVAIDDSALSRTSAPVNITVVSGFISNLTLINAGTDWKYLDNGSDQGSPWTAVSFNDSLWASDPAQLGYGDGDESTTVSFGPNSGANYITTYFRRKFVINDPASVSSLSLRLLRDDGALVHLNGSEIYRNNMPGGAIGYLTPAPASVPDENAWYASPVNPGYLVPGTNTVAVEMHQAGGGSSDLSFDFELTGVQSFIAPFITQQPQSQTVAAGSVATLSVAASGTAPLHHQWRKNGVNLPAATNASLTFAGAQLADSGSYSVVITNGAGAVTSLVATLTVSVLDTDSDGMPDVWEDANGLKKFVNDAALDADSDGLTNLEEFTAGTDPQDAQSCLKVEQITGGLGSAMLRFNTVSNLTYSVLYRDTLPGSSWLKLTSIAASVTNSIHAVPDAATNGQRYYRLVTPSVP